MTYFYFVCTCEAKFFKTYDSAVCPRCGKKLTSNEQINPPWLPVFYVPQEIAEILRVGLSTVYDLLQTGKLVGHRAPSWRVEQKDLEAYLAKTRQEPAAPVSRTTTGPVPRLKHLRL